ncbi:hypothetical protein PG988_001354 [Apiospora saccharicola]
MSPPPDPVTITEVDSDAESEADRMFPVKHNHSNAEEPAEYAGTMSEDGNINGDLHKTDARQNGDSDYEVRVKREPCVVEAGCRKHDRFGENYKTCTSETGPVWAFLGFLELSTVKSLTSVVRR